MNSTAVTTDDILVSIHDLGKMYTLYNKPQDRLKSSLFRRFGKVYGRPFWALQNISFKVRQGETIGIIGRNGSGKSTLLQIIAGTLQPTLGEVSVKGRVTALLELGSGFNPEYTGRENIYMNGIVLGLSRKEIEELYNQILAFADIGEFIEQPVKLYSSGMAMRLAFAVQVYVPKQVFIVDEALSVGDAAFQYKCMASLEKFKRAGGTVLLVTHSPQLIVQQCDRALLLDHGSLLVDGESKPVTDLYQKLIYSESENAARMIEILRQDGLKQALNYNPLKGKSIDNKPNVSQVQQTQGYKQTEDDGGPEDTFVDNLPKVTDEVTYGTGAAEIFDFGVYNDQGMLSNMLVAGRSYHWKYKVEFYQDARDVVFGMMLKTAAGVAVTSFSSISEHGPLAHIPSSSIVEVSFSLKMNVVPGDYFLNAGVSSQKDEDIVFLNRRVDVHMIKVALPDSHREIGGIAYLDPHFTYDLKPKGL